MYSMTISDLSDLFLKDLVGSYRPPRYTSTLQYNVTTDDTATTVEVMAAGVAKDTLELGVSENILTIKAPAGKGKFSKPLDLSFPLSAKSDTANIAATLENGVLTVTVPHVKKQEKKINITVS